MFWQPQKYHLWNYLSHSKTIQMDWGVLSIYMTVNGSDSGLWEGFSLLVLHITNCSHKSNRDTSESKWCMCICLVMSEVETDTQLRSRHQKHKRGFNKCIGHHGNHQLAAPKKKEKFFALMERACSTICPSFPSTPRRMKSAECVCDRVLFIYLVFSRLALVRLTCNVRKPSFNLI